MVDAAGRVELLVDLKLPFHQRYATLSHCWGKSQNLKLTSRSSHDLRKGISVSDLPTSYREAIMIAGRFGIRYLWIDSLCIMQDSEDDWLFEASRMGDIYKHSELNIAASGASESSQPCFSERSVHSIRPGRIDTQ